MAPPIAQVIERWPNDRYRRSGEVYLPILFWLFVWPDSAPGDAKEFFMEVRVEGQMVEGQAGDSVASVLQKALSGKKFKAVVAARALGGAEGLLDLSSPVPAG